MERFSLPILGADKEEFSASIIIALLGYVFVWILFPPIGPEYHGPNVHQHLPWDASRVAAHFVVTLISLLCAINAYRDKDNLPDKRTIIFIWCIVLCLWMLLSLWQLSYCWGRIPSLLRPSWMQGE